MDHEEKLAAALNPPGNQPYVGLRNRSRGAEGISTKAGGGGVSFSSATRCNWLLVDRLFFRQYFPAAVHGFMTTSHRSPSSDVCVPDNKQQ